MIASAPSPGGRATADSASPGRTSRAHCPSNTPSAGNRIGRVRNRLYRTRPRCTYCGARINRDRASIDHVVPRSKGGSKRVGNLALACTHCNNSKGDRHPLDWALTILQGATSAAAVSLLDQLAHDLPRIALMLVQVPQTEPAGLLLFRVATVAANLFPVAEGESR